MDRLSEIDKISQMISFLSSDVHRGEATANEIREQLMYGFSLVEGARLQIKEMEGIIDDLQEQNERLKQQIINAYENN